MNGEAHLGFTYIINVREYLRLTGRYFGEDGCWYGASEFEWEQASSTTVGTTGRFDT